MWHTAQRLPHTLSFGLPATSITPFASSTPEFGLTQYFFGAVVLILKQTFFSEGFVNFIYEVTGEVNGPEN